MAWSEWKALLRFMLWCLFAVLFGIFAIAYGLHEKQQDCNTAVLFGMFALLIDTKGD